MSPNRFGDERAPKPYAFVPFAQRIRRASVIGHERLDLQGHYTGRLTFALRALTPVFVGTGSYALGEEAGFPQEEVVRPFYRVNGVPAVPGSSLKGMARSVAEAVSPSCVTVTRVNPSKLPRGAQLSQGRRDGCQPANACPACSMFGRMNRLSKVQFGDAPLAGESGTRLFRLAPLYSPKAFRTPPVYLDERGEFQGRKFYFHSRPAQDERQPPVEVVPPKREFQAWVDFENLSTAELGLLFFALGVDGTLKLKLGGGKPLGLGSLRAVKPKLALLGPAHYTQADPQETVYTGDELGQFVGQAIDAALAEKILLREQALALAKILAFTQERLAPEGMY
ncbi:MAG: RAMP superfamily CRISPR-associated protein [Anaerolineae bacterium]|jgi:CRISPR/Cas system CSM-associated protein Csm3 (group 7 of RAMP superfamily)